MKYIKKSEEPKSFTVWKNLANEDWQPTWDDFRKPQKTDVHDSLLEEQGFICCYCGRRITKDISHIEHLKPRYLNTELGLEYTNMLASCQRERERKEPLHCGSKKDHWYDEDLIVSPINANCEEFFKYTDDGQILATNNSKKQLAAETTIDKLALNIDKLKDLRAKALEPILEIINTITEEDRQDLILGFSETDSKGHYEEFCAAIIYLLKN
ncbi:MAG: TIGR02646 family protein [Nostoc sp. NOS(2021)]|uniref:retron system putative HNH endonuclease n=1 Tax=Nostoc sp. NOS(2021) TaxID=2815407 RepID=UPI0025E66A98|nr:retron system putative HNH endonuclease [Nostoc sp. NOS(2021)]MBN3897534.1 TIGR02646 family protein [Nostoc sp. NOS(2021)]